MTITRVGHQSNEVTLDVKQITQHNRFIDYNNIYLVRPSKTLEKELVIT